MRLLLVTGTGEELRALRGLLSLQFDRSRGLYLSLKSASLFALSAGAGLSRRRLLRRALRELKPDIVVNAGLVGLLRLDDPRPVGERLALRSVLESESGLVYPGGPGRDTLVSVGSPVFEPWEKDELALRFKATACEMEAAPLLALLGRTEEVAESVTVIFVKVIGDRPESYDLFRYEHLVRGWYRDSLWERIRTGFLFPGGPLRLRRLLGQKAEGLDGLRRAVGGLLPGILSGRAKTGSIDSVFIPH
ncbi:MAG: hypothetical protein H7A21_17130 [Spirochaetales bacterium]|nr:hypothetical protein [Leptospiraceae bacterium]MCP5483164.1 hypothetical protein [Spirochaetales bacterium]MCP5484604.1 hypothetical protein [Spirochaetales bacterium]